MAPSTSSHFHAERKLARHFSAKRSIESHSGRDFVSSSQIPTPTSSPSKSGPAGVTLPPHGTAALVGIIVVLSFFVLAFAAWRIWVYRRNKRTPPSEKFGQNVGMYDAVDEDIVKRSSSSTILVAAPSGVKPVLIRGGGSGEFKINLAYQPKVVYVAPQEQKSAPPGIAVTPAPPSLQITPPPAYDKSIPSPSISPRTIASIAPTVANVNATKFPRLVIVESTFATTLNDELKIQVGETLRLLEEYEDEWCLVQRVGPKNAEKGVIPRFCVVEKPEAPPVRRSKYIPRLTSSNVKI
ncbi:hypothetical protein BU17DRAFT_91736 [Hysterangium stoloniferum]|nr:hypothetical protein BU17DRAFT_91736 [Hysterangium stoloniferum]